MTVWFSIKVRKDLLCQALSEPPFNLNQKSHYDDRIAGVYPIDNGESFMVVMELIGNNPFLESKWQELWAAK